MGKNMKNLIVLFGTKCSGKTTSATAIYGYHLTQKGVIPNAEFDDDGKMTVVYDREKNEGVEFDIDSRDEHMLEFYKKNIWGHVKHASFADSLKQSCISLFSLNTKKVFGSNKDKDTETHIEWANLAKLLEPKRAAELIANNGKFVSIRRLLEVFGTEVCRTIDDLCHIKSAHHNLLMYNPEIGIIPDGRFVNEFRYFQKLKKNRKPSSPNVWLIKHARSPMASDAPSETGMPEIKDEEYDLVIPEGLNMAEKNHTLISFLIEKEVLSSTGVKTY
jgi:hypothetical protein